MAVVPEQIVVLDEEEIFAAGIAFTVTAEVADAVHPFAAVMVTV